MPVPITRYRTSRLWIWAGLAAVAITAVSGWVAFRWPYAWIPAGLGVASAILMFLLAFRPIIDIFESHLKVGEKAIPWAQIRRLDRIFIVPLVVRATLSDRRSFLLVHAGNSDTSEALLRQVRRYSREALIDGVPYRQFWGEAPASAERRQVAPKRYPLLLPEDEAEVERLFQRLKSVGHIDPKSSDEK